MSKYTKGPWKVADQKPGHCGRQQEQDRLIYVKDETGEPLHVAETFQYQNHGHCAADGTSLANAKLIAAAPELLHHLKIVLMGYEALRAALAECCLDVQTSYQHQGVEVLNAFGSNLAFEGYELIAKATE